MSTPDLPEIPECFIERTADGLLLTHKGSGQTALARDEGEELTILATILRVWAARGVPRDPEPITTGTALRQVRVSKPVAAPAFTTGDQP